MKKILIVIMSVAAIFSCASEGATEVSGIVDAGLRVIDVPDGTSPLEFTIYRGDYIVFDFEKAGSYDFKVPGLEIDTVMPRPSGEQSYVKMKKSGDYKFTLGDRSGVFHVRELEGPGYYELMAPEAAELIENVDPVIIDVRTPGEFESGHIPEAMLLPVQIFEENLSALEKYKGDDILLYCASGNRSTVAARILIEAGFDKVYNLRHGFGDWARNGFPVE